MIENALIDGDKRPPRKHRNQYTAVSYITDTHKQCSWCFEIKEHSEFHKDKNNKRGKGLTYYCKICATQKTRAHHAKHKNSEDYNSRKRNSYFKTKYQLTLSQRDELLKKQEGKCAICSTSLKETGGSTHTDHCHTTGKVRGILCTNCNRGLGHFKDSITNLEAAISYLKGQND